MTKSEKRECDKLTHMLAAGEINEQVAGYAARGFSSLARASRNPGDIHAVAAQWPAVYAHPDYI